MKKNTKLLILFYIFSLSGFSIFGQTNCKVLLESISSEYTGKCKKGFAHGKGKAIGIDTYEGSFKKGLPHGNGAYKWASGNIYIGKWENGVKQGEGKLIIYTTKKDSVLEGIWSDNKYIGPIPKKPKVTRKRSVDRYTIRRIQDGNIVEVKLLQNGAKNSSIEDFSMAANSGSYYTTGSLYAYENINFPFICIIRYRTWNKLHASQTDVVFEFTIFEKGRWVVTINN